MTAVGRMEQDTPAADNTGSAIVKEHLPAQHISWITAAFFCMFAIPFRFWTFRFYHKMRLLERDFPNFLPYIDLFGELNKLLKRFPCIISQRCYILIMQ